MAVMLDPEVVQEYCGYWLNATALSTPSLKNEERKKQRLNRQLAYISALIQIVFRLGTGN